ncbi:MAG: ABC transporter permease [Candidatus Omnitrophota bacterium]
MKERIRHILFHRHLVWEFLRRDLQARYIGSAMGFFWSVVNPLILLLVYTFVFGYIFRAKYEVMGFDAGGASPALYIFCGLLPWYALQESLIRSTTCIVDNAHLIKQVRFPAKVLPFYLTLSSIVNQLIGTAIFLLFLIPLSHKAPISLLALPIVFGLEIVLFLGLGLLFATLNVYLRDIGPLVSIGLMILMWSAPIFYTLAMETLQDSRTLQLFIQANPLTYFITIHHKIMLQGVWPSWNHWMILGGIAAMALALGYWLFTRCHQEFADLI